MAKINDLTPHELLYNILVERGKPSRLGSFSITYEHWEDEPDLDLDGNGLDFGNCGNRIINQCDIQGLGMDDTTLRIRTIHKLIKKLTTGQQIASEGFVDKVEVVGQGGLF